MKLIITEKPSVAKSVAGVIGATKKKGGHLEGSGYLVSWCFGHLCGLAPAGSYRPEYAQWRLEDLPIIPKPFKTLVQKDKETQLNLVKELMLSPDVTEVINACDAGREGELIFRSVYNLSGCRKPVKRLWISSMEDAAIRDGMENLLPGEQFDGLYMAALSRAEADWLVGINASRFFSLTYNKKLNVGRVMSPTLAMLVLRESEISAFQPESYYTVQLGFDGFSAVSDKLKEKTAADQLAADCGETAAVLRVEQKQKTEKAPALYDLTTIQRDANRLLGFTAQQTLDYLQALYEKKLCTYPRTDSRFLTEDMEETVPSYVGVACRLLNLEVPASIQCKQVCDSGKVSDHHALIPTMTAASADVTELPKGEQDILKLVALGLIRAVCEPFQYMDTVVSLDCGGHSFTAKGKTVLNAGWMQYHPEREKKSATLPLLTEGQQLPVIKKSVKEGQTTAPKHYTEDTLLAAMENAGAKDMPEEAERKGLGTPATRAGILEKMIAVGFVERRKAKKLTSLIPTALGGALITVLPEQLQSPQLTVEWEYQLLRIEQRTQEQEAFLEAIADMLTELFRDYHPVPGADVLFSPDKPVIGKCPRCGGNVVEAQKGYFCEKRECRFVLWKNSKFFQEKKVAVTKAIAAALLQEGKVELTGCVSKKTGKRYDAIAVLQDDGAKTFFCLEFPQGDKHNAAKQKSRT